MHNKPGDWQGKKKKEKREREQREEGVRMRRRRRRGLGVKHSLTSCLKHCRHLRGNNITTPPKKMEIKCLFDFSSKAIFKTECFQGGSAALSVRYRVRISPRIATVSAAFLRSARWFHHPHMPPLKFLEDCRESRESREREREGSSAAGGKADRAPQAHRERERERESEREREREG